MVSASSGGFSVPLPYYPNRQGVVFERPPSSPYPKAQPASRVPPSHRPDQVTLCSICGSDLHPFLGRETGIARGTVVGHEFVGIVAAVGTAVRTLVLGDRVMSPFTACCGGCFYCQRGATCR